jgi:predicted nucleic acid-binding protein
MQYGVSGVQVRDAQLAAAMYTHGISRILTFNGSDFSRFSEITAIHPAAV